MKKILIAAALFIADANVAAVAADNVTEINQDEFVSKIYDYRTDSVAKSMALPAVVDFWAPWCAPCLRLAPIIDELAEKYAGKVNFYKMNIDDNQQLARDLGISSIPLVVLFPNDGTPIKGMMGVQPKDFIEGMINESLLHQK
ncbi:thioredoxin [uncultured Muribaculum sp.]|uniref:thioredoxin n=1 Tax=uncultured Muribaculum sp. TaxID=1918613 RepID=UPI00259490C6|nr:thioredoxin [uncultured Muribaculum sp.]